MVSPEFLRRLAMFAPLSTDALYAVAMLAEEVTAGDGDIIVEADAPADALYVLEEGGAELYYVTRDNRCPDAVTEHFIGELHPGEPLGISALLEPYTYRGRVRCRGTARLLRVDAPGLRALCELDRRLGFVMMRQVAHAAADRLAATESQLATQHA